MDNITGSNPLILEAHAARDKLALKGGNEQLVAKFDDLLSKSCLHSAEAAKLRNLIIRAEQS
ncbi:hypothetical protein SAMN04489798_2307 [Pseudomonas arsenicoxydans]|uniref:Uncharacterized protein n=1 Tax=Pseudomonas arsenicoxydans TaxID=702115 RepID=A0A1H0HLT9_9PSED|nr:hypothetical protein [Pseudomonas arsenicoxydans]SDO20145.1 hypothetical protein SAMN04489798_2307 [Pseudomonas arsenicoxydans]